MDDRRATPDRRQRRLLAVMAAAGAVTTGAVCLLLPVLPELRVLLATVGALLWIALAAAARESLVGPLRGLANVVEALRTGDYAMRGRVGPRGEPFGDLVREVNQLSTALHGDRLRALEATALLEQLVATVDVAVLALDGRGLVRLANAPAERLLDGPPGPVGRSAAELGLVALLDGHPGTQMLDAVAGRPGRWQVTHGTFREDGMAQHLLVITDLKPTLREEERAAWQRLLRVMGHEVKNSLTPIRSIAGTVRTLISRDLPEWARRADALEGLRVIEDRSAALDRFLVQYRRLSHVPPPRPVHTEVAPLLRRVAALAPSPVQVHVDERLEAMLDPDLLEQALLNLLRNAVEAAGPEGSVALEAAAAGHRLAIRILDDGPGIENPDNLFVPFFTTKPGGSGIGLALSRQIAELHGGTLTLENRDGARGAVAMMELPLRGGRR